MVRAVHRRRQGLKSAQTFIRRNSRIAGMTKAELTEAAEDYEFLVNQTLRWTSNLLEM